MLRSRHKPTTEPVYDIEHGHHPPVHGATGIEGELLRHEAAVALIRENPEAATLNDVQTITGRPWSDLLAEKVESIRLGS